MVSELTPVHVDPETAGSDFWKGFHELRRMRHAELRPADPIRPDDITEDNIRRPDPFDLHEFFEVSRDGVMLSTFRGDYIKPGSPEYESNKHLYWADAYVRSEERRKGIGKLWLKVLAERMDAHGATVFGLSAENDQAHAFMKWLGATPKLTDIESRLELAKVDWAMLRRWVEEGQQRSPQTRLEIHDGRLPEELWADFAVQRTALLNTMPFEDLDLGQIVVTPEKIAEWVERAALTQTVWHNILTREADGTISGMTDVEWTPYGRKQIQQQFTGVLPAARSRGIGKWIKAAMLLHLRELYPDAEWVVTDNAHSNAPMLKINRAMGYKPYRTTVDYQMTRDELGAKLRSL